MAKTSLGRHDVFAIGASSGGVEALSDLVAGLPEDLPASLFVVIHLPSESKSVLPQILSRSGPLRAAHAKDNEAIQRGRIYVAPPDQHLLLRQDRIQLVRGPRENNHRPAIDPLFRAAARTYRNRAVGIVLSGARDDGAAGLIAIKKVGGIAIVQDPDEAIFPDMPRSALKAVTPDFCLPIKEIAKTIVTLSSQSLSKEQGMVMDDEMKKETDIVEMNERAIEDDDKPGTPSVFGCPDCGGVLWELQDDEWLRFRCRVGHAYSAEGLMANQGENLEQALWNAYRVLHEHAALARRLVERARENKMDLVLKRYETRAHDAEQQAQMIRELLMSGKINSRENVD
jgi:two-component system, chemotaxis family, protein-glutamate methylesterase/glutaminase